jgi:AcrR family transcriptional regulator
MSSQKASAASAREPVRDRGKARVKALLDAGAAEFAERGFEGATMTAIAARAGAAIGSLYQFFPSKEALADALLAHYGDTLNQGIAALAGIENPSPEAIAGGLVDLMIVLRSVRAAAHALSEGPQNSDHRMRLRGQMRRGIAGLLRAAGAERPDAKAIVILHMLKAVPALADDSTPGLVDEMRGAITLYIADAASRRER